MVAALVLYPGNSVHAQGHLATSIYIVYRRVPELMITNGQSPLCYAEL